MPYPISCYDWLRFQQLFYGHGKTSLYEKMAQSFKARCLLLKCGESLPLKNDICNDLKLYVVRYVYGEVRSTSLGLTRVAK